MNPLYDNLPPSLSQAVTELFDEAKALGIDPKLCAAMVIAPLVSDHITEAETLVGQRLDTVRAAIAKHGTKVMRLLGKLSVTLFIEYLRRFRTAKKPWQKTRWRLVICGDDSLLVHAEESDQPDVVNIWSTLYKTYRKAHDLIVLGVTVGPKTGNFFFPLWVELWRQPGCRRQTRPQRMAAAIYRLNEQVQKAGETLCGIDIALDNGYHSPTVAEALGACGLVMTTHLRGNQSLQSLCGESITTQALRDQLIADSPIRCDPRAGRQAYYWPKQMVHPYLGQGTLVIQRRKLKSGGFEYHYHFSQHQNAKAITVLQIAKRRWPIEVFFRDTKQHLSMGHLPYRKWSSLRGHIACRGLLYFLLAKVRQKWRLEKKTKTIGAIKRRYRNVWLDIFLPLFPLGSAPIV